MKNKLIAGIITLAVAGGAVTPAFAATKCASQNNIMEAKPNKSTCCSISGGLLHGVTIKKIWWGNCSNGTIIIGGVVNKPNHNENNNTNDTENNNSNTNNGNTDNNNNTNNNNSTVIPPTNNTEKPNSNNPSVDEKPGNTGAPSTGNTEKPSKPNKPTVDETPSTPQETPSVPDTPVVDDTHNNITENNTTNADSNYMAAVETAIFNKVNEERAKAGVPALAYNTTMERYARIKSKDMGDNNYFSHEDLNGNLMSTQIKNDGLSYRAWGENIAYIGGMVDPNTLANQFMTNWMNSQGHRENILSTNFTSIGVGVYKIGNKVYATQEFYK